MSGAADVVVVDDDVVMTDLLELALEGEADLALGGVAAEPEQAREMVAELRPAVILLDAVNYHTHWPAGDPRLIDPLDLAGELKELSPESWLILWTSWEDPDVNQENMLRLAIRGWEAGAEDILSKQDGLRAVLAYIREKVQSGAAPPPDDPTKRALIKGIGRILRKQAPKRAAAENGHPELEVLTPTERERAPLIARGLEEGLKLEHVASALSYSHDTIKGNMRDYYTKWRIKNHVQFVAKVHELGLLD